MTRKRIALFSTAYHPFVGGAEVAIKEITDRMDDFEFDLFTVRLRYDLPTREKIGNVNVYRLGGSGNQRVDKILFPWRARRLALAKHRQNPYDLWHGVMANYAGLAAWLCKRKYPRVPYLLTLQSGDSDLFIWSRTWFWYPIYKKIYSQADRIAAISRFLAGRARKYGYQKNVEIIPNGVDIENFDIVVNQEDRVFIRKSWGLGESDFVIITASRLVAKNGIDILIDSLRYLPKSVKLVIAGVGQDEKKLKVKSLDFKDRVVFLGYIDHTSLPRVLKAADAFVRPSRSEGLGNSFLEAMAAGLPVVGAKVGGIVDFIKDKSTGFLVSPEDPKAVAGAVSQVLNDKNLVNNIVVAGRKLVSEKYNWQVIVSKYRIVYRSLMQ